MKNGKSNGHAHPGATSEVKVGPPRRATPAPSSYRSQQPSQLSSPPLEAVEWWVFQTGFPHNHKLVPAQTAHEAYREAKLIGCKGSPLSGVSLHYTQVDCWQVGELTDEQREQLKRWSKSL